MKHVKLMAMVYIFAAMTTQAAFAQNLGESAPSPSTSDVMGNIRHGFGIWAPNEKVREVQQALRDKGYYKGELDGVLNPEFRRAIWNFQQDNGLPRTASLDRPTLAALGLAAAGAASPGGATTFGATAPVERIGGEAP
jgi:peptidoglycan hydrolase-like protein with peptidoglycan-binding domain